MKQWSFKSREHYIVKHDGKDRTAYVVTSPFAAADPGALFDCPVEIDGQKHHIVAVDVDGDKGIKVGQPLSLIVQ